MLVLGRKYKFTQLEQKRLNQKNHTLHIVKYNKKDPQTILKEIKELIENKMIKTIVLNTKTTIDIDIIKYLTNIQFEKNISMITIEHFVEKYLHKCYIPENNIDLNYLEDIKPFTTWQYMQKRTIDYFGVFWLFFFSWPVMLLSKKKIQKQSPGQILFKQDRVGLNKKLFKCTKFRTMHENSHHDPYTRENDTRIFPFGVTMRKTRLDELPQMINILKGEMHLIGPRAEWNILVNDYEKEIPYYNERHLIRPGITGWAQVNYPYGANIEDTKQKLMYDLYYIKNWSILLELKIVWKTAMTVIGKKGL